MKTFEEKFTAWVDGLLSGEELRQFEIEISEMENAGADKSDALRLGNLLRREYRAPELKNAEFFNHQIMQRIAAETPRPQTTTPRAAFGFFSLWRMAFAGGLSLIVAASLFLLVVRNGQKSNPTPQDVLAKVIDAQTDDPVTATSFQSKSNKVTVLWLDGLDYIPDDLASK
jgi:hypothetical protein